MGRNQAFDEGSGRMSALEIAIEAARHQHARDAGVPVEDVLPLKGRANPPAYETPGLSATGSGIGGGQWPILDAPGGKQVKDVDYPTHITTFSHLDPRTGYSHGEQAWGLYANQERPPKRVWTDENEDD